MYKLIVSNTATKDQATTSCKTFIEALCLAEFAIEILEPHIKFTRLEGVRLAIDHANETYVDAYNEVIITINKED